MKSNLTAGLTGLLLIAAPYALLRSAPSAEDPCAQAFPTTRAAGHPQGTQLRSLPIDEVALASAQREGRPVSLTWSGGALLEGRGPARFPLLLSGSTPGSQVLVCAAAAPLESEVGHHVPQYRVLYRERAAAPWLPACGADASGAPEPALVMDGVWDERAAHQPRPGTATLACEASVIHKCVRWGYVPWATHKGRSLRDHHQACTRMARADYCGDGVPHTVDGNLIEFGDSLGLHHLNASASGWRREATWAPEGARCIDQPRLATTTLAAIERECPGRVRTTGPAESPLLAADGAAPPGRCDPDAAGTLLINRTRQTADSAGMR